ncbi:MAG: hypothetical protein JXB35_15515, partial [Anaerolineae bacterium]|nr:hypothetical protein [Anaerolineae bacterium]
GLSDADLARAWQTFAGVREDGYRVFAQCLDFLGGIAVRRMGLDGGICGLAEHLVGNFSADTGASWSSVMILGEERLFDKVTKITQIIRMRFPEWDIWSLPFTAHEFGQLVASGDYVGGLREYFIDEKRRIRRLVEDAGVTAAELAAAAPDIAAMRRQFLDHGDGVAVEDFLEQQQVYLRSLFADVFATYFLGPAYIYSRIFLRLVPTTAYSERVYTPPMARRIAMMLATLQRMSQAEKRDEFAPGPYDGEIRRFETLWEQTVKPVNATFQLKFSFGEPYDSWFEGMYSRLRTEHGLVGFKAHHWEKAEDLGKQLLDTPQVAPDVQMIPIILNAAWYCRIRHPNRLGDIERRTHELLNRAIAEPAPGVTGRPQQAG